MTPFDDGVLLSPLSGLHVSLIHQSGADDIGVRAVVRVVGVAVGVDVPSVVGVVGVRGAEPPVGGRINESYP